MAQLGGGGEGGDLPPTAAYAFLAEHLEAHPLRGDADAWLEALMGREQGQLLGALPIGGGACLPACQRCTTATVASSLARRRAHPGGAGGLCSRRV